MINLVLSLSILAPVNAYNQNVVQVTSFTFTSENSKITIIPPIFLKSSRVLQCTNFQ